MFILDECYIENLPHGEFPIISFNLCVFSYLVKYERRVGKIKDIVPPDQTNRPVLTSATTTDIISTRT